MIYYFSFGQRTKQINSQLEPMSILRSNGRRVEPIKRKKPQCLSDFASRPTAFRMRQTLTQTQKYKRK